MGLRIYLKEITIIRKIEKICRWIKNVNLREKITKCKYKLNLNKILKHKRK